MTMKLDSAEDLDALTLPNSDNGVLLQLEESLRALADRPIWLLHPLFQLLERHFDFDFGTPGGIVHFLEAYPRRDYKTALLASLKRRPTTHTTWMLNRLINGTKGSAKQALLNTMDALCSATQLDVRAAARDFAALQADLPGQAKVP